jgi:hypothetical protein
MDTTTQSLASIGIDIGKELFHVVGFDGNGKFSFRRKIKRLALVETFRQLPPSVVGGRQESGALPVDHVVPRQRHGFQPLRKLHLEHH